MPPKRTSTRRAGSVRSSSNDNFLLSPPTAATPALPDVPTKSSFAYGSSTAAALPRKLAMQPQTGLLEIAQTIEEGVRAAEGRANGEELAAESVSTRTRNKSQPIPSPVRRTRREPTPDQVQLLESLRDATESPQPTGNQSGSTPTPTPPIPHTLSTASSPLEQNFALPTEQLYPSPLMRVGSPAPHASPFSPAQFQDFDGNESTISWMVERDIHEDNLQRTRGNTARGEPHGKNISAPPRRFSGLAFAYETIEEEEEPVNERSVSKSSYLEPVAVQPKHEPQSDTDPEPEPEPEPDIEPEPAPQSSSAPAKTIIPNGFLRRSPFHQPTSPPRSQRHNTDEVRLMRGAPLDFSKDVIQTAAIVVFTVVSLLIVYSIGGPIVGFSSRDSWRQPYNIPLNTTGLEAVNSLSNELVRLGAEVSALSKEMKVVKSDLQHIPAATTIVEKIRTPGHQPPQRPNFLSFGTGVLIDPYRTSPTAKKPVGYLQKIYMRILGSPWADTSPPAQALLPWDGVGDCWCSAPRDGMSQLSVVLGRPIVPEDVVVEHIPRGASVLPEVAPKEMELWVEYKVLNGTPDKPTTFLSRDGDLILGNGLSLHEQVMNYLGFAYHHQPESAYSDDPILGPTFYRVGHWTYNIDGPHHVQRFQLDVVVDMEEIRVEKAVFRVKSNWGGNQTCLYRLRLHGHL
ncbi:hypothetical protein EYZ11_001035 [Aspergillus tanneri]|uniref:SUN domain-containing protein n=1 Tax=Aspergillus tanneri TaxID=1220188 RepID=A0A4S3JVM7_9EURO|nr:uncharacterized protein ATNIH1004_001583 [Aspergillus tanneri]KAA8652678.1 hypothetical protein ATNIH1004_001583 [Aspergillus tanneri]THC99486.1 hypothetical protein EYZ11_001035 [Aspergillus tanneri]